MIGISRSKAQDFRWRDIVAFSSTTMAPIKVLSSSVLRTNHWRVLNALPPPCLMIHANLVQKLCFPWSIMPTLSKICFRFLWTGFPILVHFMSFRFGRIMYFSGGKIVPDARQSVSQSTFSIEAPTAQPYKNLVVCSWRKQQTALYLSWKCNPYMTRTLEQVLHKTKKRDKRLYWSWEQTFLLHRIIGSCEQDKVELLLPFEFGGEGIS